jgi:hypothetical protein
MLVRPEPSPMRGAAQLSSLLDRARVEAISGGRSVAVLIRDEEGVVEDHQRLLLIVSEVGEDPLDGTPKWLPVSELMRLPDGLAVRSSPELEALLFQLPIGGGRVGEGEEWFRAGFDASGSPLEMVTPLELVVGRVVEGVDLREEADHAVLVTQSGRTTPAYHLLTKDR